jgi:hypothetical protein
VVISWYPTIVRSPPSFGVAVSLVAAPPEVAALDAAPDEPLADALPLLAALPLVAALPVSLALAAGLLAADDD